MNTEKPYRIVHHIGDKGRMVYSVMRDGRDHPIETMSSGAKAEFLCQQLQFAYAAGYASRATDPLIAIHEASRDARVKALEDALRDILPLAGRPIIGEHYEECCARLKHAASLLAKPTEGDGDEQAK